MTAGRTDQPQPAAGQTPMPNQAPTNEGAIPALTAPAQGMPPPDSGQPGGGRGRVDLTGIIPAGVHVDPDITEGHPGYEESGGSQIIPPGRLAGQTAGEGANRKPAVSVEELAAVVDELIEVLHFQANDLERLITHVQQVTAHLPDESEMSVIRSSLSGLHLRIKKLRGVVPAVSREGGGPAPLPGE